jgi:hypothetical protein
VVLSVLCAAPAEIMAQVTEVVGTRALGMAGAFVAVADDATAVFWNPAGLGFGPVLDVTVEHQDLESLDPRGPGVGEDSFMIALGTPSFGLTYYRLRTLSASPLVPPGSDETLLARSDLRKLSTHHFGAAFVQSLAPFLIVGTTVNIVRGTAAIGTLPTASLERALDLASELGGRTETKMNLDAGVMAVFGGWRVGVVGRNLREPEFDTSDQGDATDTGALKLSRQVRAGIAYAPRSRPAGTNGPLTLAADIDLEPVETPFGDRRELAVGGEGWLWAGRIGGRAGIRFNTLKDQFTSHDPVYAVGISVSPRAGSLVEGQITRGRNELERGWGISARVTF